LVHFFDAFALIDRLSRLQIFGVPHIIDSRMADLSKPRKGMLALPEERKKIIIVDDTPIVLKLARNALMGQYDVFTAPSAEKMFQFLEKTLPDLILLDVLMPEINGYDAIRLLKSGDKTAGIPVIFLSSRSNPEIEREGFSLLSLGAVDYIVKPFSPQLLLKRVESHIPTCCPPSSSI
jgi:putative two-component system response regulator